MYLMKGLLPLTLILSFFCASAVMAYTPENLTVKTSDIPSKGKASNIAGNFSLTNTTDTVLVVNYQYKKNTKYAFKVRPSRFILKPGQTTRVRYNGAIRTSGKFQVLFNFSLKARDGRDAGQFEFPQYFKVQKGIYIVSDYESLYMNRRQSDGLGKYFVDHKFNGDIPMANDEYKTKRPSVGEMLELDRDSLYDIPTDSKMLGDDRDPRVILRPRPPIGDFINDIIPNPKSATYLEASPLRPVDKVNYTVRGRFSYKGMDGQLHPAFGWRVQLMRVGFFDQWRVVTSAWVEPDGSWHLSASRGGNYRLRYVAANPFFSLMNEEEDVYHWMGPVRKGLTRDRNEGHRYADLDEGDARGLGEVYSEGMDFWSKLYSSSINPLRDKTIKFFYPNTFETCSSRRSFPWSCASIDGEIWLIPEHASRFGVTTHELAHQINYEFWDNEVPAGAGGRHNLVDCFGGGLVLAEGFANFMVFWAHQDRSKEPLTGYDFNAETPPDNYCTMSLARNEGWVAAAFWDLHDTRTDGDDRLWFTHKGSVPAIYLRNGVQNSMGYFHSIYRDHANSEHSQHIDNILKQNHIID